jgi:hypothetical protein
LNGAEHLTDGNFVGAAAEAVTTPLPFFRFEQPARFEVEEHLFQIFARNTAGRRNIGDLRPFIACMGANQVSEGFEGVLSSISETHKALLRVLTP